MDPITLQQTAAVLLVYIQAAVGMEAVPLSAPEIEFIPKYELAEKSCGDPKCDVLGWFSNAQGIIYLNDELDIAHDLQHRSILLHELVHYVQEQIKSPVMENQCLTWKMREIEAYGVQYRWLRDNRVRVKTPAYNVRLARIGRMNCPPGNPANASLE